MTAFDMTIQLPPDAGFASMVRQLAQHGARQCGCPDSAADAFGLEVEEAARQALARTAGPQPIRVAVRRDTGPMEVVIGSGDAARTMTLDV